MIEIYGLEGIKNAIFSTLIKAQLREALSSRTLHVHAIIDAIKEIQSGVEIRTEKERPFYGDILKGHWYKHWFEARFIPTNLMNHWKMGNENSTKFQDMMKTSFKKRGVRDGDIITEKAFAQMTDDFIFGAYFERLKKSKMTGERIIFKPYEGKNYFLTLSLHSESDEEVLKRILANCQIEFPFIF